MKSEFVDCSGCTECPLHEGPKNPGLPTRGFNIKRDGIGPSSLNPRLQYERVLLVVGEAPGYNEDQQGKSWIGYSGQLLAKFLEASGVTNHCDVFLSNGCRCRPPQNSKPTRGQMNTCRPSLLEDIRRLDLQYKEVIVLACGAPACYTVGRMKSLVEATKHQGMKGLDLGLPEESAPTLFFTYHPALLHPKRQPAKVQAVEAHFTLLARYLTGDFIPNSLTVTPDVGAPPPRLTDGFPRMVCVDIETYGILKGKEQTVFHPVKSREIDGIPFDEQIVTVSIGYFDNEGRIKTSLYIYKDEQHREYVEEWFKRIVQTMAVVVGQNVKFDLLYLSTVNKVLNYWIDPRWMILDDTLLLGFLLYEQRPEKGLKELSTLFGITSYEDLSVTGKCGIAKSPYDSALHYYNCLDVAATLTLYEEVKRRIGEKYGAGSRKLTDDCTHMRNMALWCVLELERQGCTMDMKGLCRIHEEKKAECKRIVEELDGRGVIAKGLGSEKSLREFISRAVEECGLRNDKRVILTDKRKALSIGKENVNLVLEYLPEGELRSDVELFKSLQTQSKIINTYTGPLLTQPRRGIVHEISERGGVGIVYPSWYPVPSYHDRGGVAEEKSGGTIQGRFSCKGPAAQTFPDEITACLTTRFNPGMLKGYDMSQIELRVAALLSGDPVLMQAYVDNLDLHSETAKGLFPDKEYSAGEWKESEGRQLAKIINFLVLYRGGAKAFQDTAMRELKLALDIDYCQRSINSWYARHMTFKNWQDKLLHDAQKGYIELVTGWSRTYGVGMTGVAAYTNEVCNHPIQTLSAQMLQSSEFVILQQIRKYRLKTRLALQIHDSLIFDMPPEEEEIVDSIVHEALTRPPLMSIIEKAVNRSIELKYSAKVYMRYGC